MTHVRIPIALAALGCLALAGCNTPGGKWRRASLRADWLLTELAAFHARDNLAAHDPNDLERERADLELRVRVAQKDGKAAYREGDEEGIRISIAELKKLEDEIDTLRLKYK